jgi:predicted dehydrogenase
MDPIRIGVVGLGHRGVGWLRILQAVPGYRIVALCDPIAPLHERALAALSDRRDVARYTRYDDLLADPNVEAVGLCVRSPDQGALAARALEAGKHVSAEVPAAHSLEDCWRIVLAAERSGRVYHLAEQTRYWGFVEAWRRLVAEGRLGHVTLGEGQYFHYYPAQTFQDPRTGRFFSPSESAAHPEARPTWLAEMPPIHYLPHELSPLLSILDDRVVQVVAMSTRGPSYAHPELPQPDLQMALMKTEKDAILRLGASFNQPHPARNYHWYQVLGTRGRVEWKRTERDSPKLWLADAQMHDPAAVDWRYERTDAPPEARGSGHGDADYYTHAAFRDAVRGGRPLDLDVYKAMDTAAPAILAAESIARGSQPLAVPDFRPGPSRRPGQSPPDPASPSKEPP